MKRLINVLTAVFLVLVIVFAAACTYGSVGMGAMTESYSDESAITSELSTDIKDMKQTEEACMPASDFFETAIKRMTTSTVPDNGNETSSSKKTNETETAETVSDDSTGTMTLEINEVGDGWFTACHPWPSPLKYKVIYELGGKYKSGDFVEVSYNIEEFDSEASPAVLHACSVIDSDFQLKPNVTYKPVIYLYPEEKTEVSVKINYNGRLTYTIPEYGNGWKVTAYPNGRIVNSDGAKYPYLFWEGEGESDYALSEGFCIKGSDAEKFLCEKLSLMGMSKSEIEDFNEFWVPFLQKNPYNRICFQTTAYTDNAELVISPKPDSVLRVFMVYTPLEKPIRIKSQSIDTFERKGFAVLEWGGAIVTE